MKHTHYIADRLCITSLIGRTEREAFKKETTISVYSPKISSDVAQDPMQHLALELTVLFRTAQGTVFVQYTCVYGIVTIYKMNNNSVGNQRPDIFAHTMFNDMRYCLFCVTLEHILSQQNTR
jgi:hypothetical protein